MNNNLSVAEKAMLAFWHDYVRSYSPNARRYDPGVHTLNRTRLFYLMTEDMIEYLKECGVSNYTEVALNLMGVTSGTLTNWRAKWGKLSRIVHHIAPEASSLNF
ncbi:MAG: hypothetical protein IJT12_03850 [Paludibacteraceae bacterium]|nr:hypothetical protein [Paludibacteraceae bacterium]